LPNTFTLEQRAFMLAYWNYACAICGNQEGFWHLLADDHWIPINSPDCPGTVADNMIPLCHGTNGCNNAKNSSEPQAWLVKQFGTSKARKLSKAIEAYFAVVTQRKAS
jgi:hypothetical protein